MRKLLFICGRNLRRSPTAEAIFDVRLGVESESTGISSDAQTPVTTELIRWADVVFVMERTQRAKLVRQFGRHLAGKKVVCLNIADDYEYMDPQLVRLLWERVPRSVPGLTHDRS